MGGGGHNVCVLLLMGGDFQVLPDADDTVSPVFIKIQTAHWQISLNQKTKCRKMGPLKAEFTLELTRSYLT